MTMIFKKAIPRRAFLRGTGVALALPLLDSMFPAFAAANTAAAKPAVRLGYLYLPVGRVMDRWTPKTEGTGYEMTPTLEPLAPFREQFSVVSGLNIQAADPWPGERGGTHARPSAAYLTGVHPRPNNSLGISADQVVARETGKHTQLASLELGLDPPIFAGGNEADYDGYYRSTISWRSPTTPLPIENNPRKIFERMFGDSDTTDSAVQLRRIQRRQSILDSVNERVARLMGTVGPGDRVKLAEYLEAVRDVERRIQVAEQAASSQNTQEHPPMQRPPGVPATFEEHAKLMLDLMVMAYRTDLTRVVTFMMGWEGTNRTYREIGSHDGHHSLSHHKGMREAIAMLEKIDLYQSQMVAYFIGQMQSTADGEGTLLDHSLIVSGSALSDGNLHLHNDVPTLLIGGAGGQLKGGRHVRYQGLPLSNLHLATFDVLGVADEGYVTKDSDATGKLEGLFGWVLRKGQTAPGME